MAESIASLRRVSMTGSITWNNKKQGVGIFVAIYGVIFGFGYWYVFIHAYN